MPLPKHQGSICKIEPTSFLSGKILIAVSGGVDSCVLLDVITKHRKDGLFVAHVNHNLRGAESDTDEEFVRSLAKKHAIPFFSKKLEPAPKSEDEGRKARYAFFAEIKQKLGIDWIALAHHKDDQIETMFMQMARGTQGFSPMQEFSTDGKWRPLLSFTKMEITDYAQKQGIKWREDSTNTQNDYTRNRLRNTVLPELRAINSNFDEVFLRFALDVNENTKTFADEAEKIVQTHSKGIHRKEFLSFSRSLQKAIIKRLNPDLYAKNIDEVLEMIGKGAGGKEKHGIHLERGGLITPHITVETKNFSSLPRLILASSSPQRQRLLSDMKYDFEVIPSQYDEAWDDTKTIKENIKMFAEKKAEDVFKDHPDAQVIGCDTFVVHPKYGVYLKPKDRDEALKMMESYSETQVRVLSGIALLSNKKRDIRLVETLVDFANISKVDALWWLDQNEWQGRSGACSIEGSAMRFVKGINGCFFNIIGLPSQVLGEMINSFE